MGSHMGLFVRHALPGLGTSISVGDLANLHSDCGSKILLCK